MCVSLKKLGEIKAFEINWTNLFSFSFLIKNKFKNVKNDCKKIPTRFQSFYFCLSRKISQENMYLM